MQPKIFDFPQHQYTLFLGVLNLVPTLKNTPGTSTSSRSWWWIFFFASVLWLLTTNIPETWYSPIVGGAISASHFRGRHSRALEIHEVELSTIFFLMKKWWRCRPKTESRDVTGSCYFCETDPHDLKKQGGKRFPSQFHRSNFITPRTDQLTLARASSFRR